EARSRFLAHAARARRHAAADRRSGQRGAASRARRWEGPQDLRRGWDGCVSARSADAGSRGCAAQARAQALGRGDPRQQHLRSVAMLASPTLAELLMPLPAANPFSTMRASLRWYSSEELEDGVTYGGQSWLRRGSVDSFFSALLLRDGDAAGRRKRSSS